MLWDPRREVLAGHSRPKFQFAIIAGCCRRPIRKLSIAKVVNAAIARRMGFRPVSFGSTQGCQHLQILQRYSDLYPGVRQFDVALVLHSYLPGCQ
jgi:hypothetical protein